MVSFLLILFQEVYKMRYKFGKHPTLNHKEEKIVVCSIIAGVIVLAIILCIMLIAFDII